MHIYFYLIYSLSSDRTAETDPKKDHRRMVESLKESDYLVHPSRMDSFNKAVDSYDSEVNKAG